MPDPRLKTYAPQAVRHLAAAGHVLADRARDGRRPEGQRPRLARLRRRRFPRHAVGDLDLGASPAAVGCDPLPGAARRRLGVRRDQREALHSRRHRQRGGRRDRVRLRAGPARERRRTRAGRAPTGSGRRSPIARRACSPIIWARWRTCPGASSAIPGSWRSRSPNTRAPSTIAVCWRARASSSTARSG